MAASVCGVTLITKFTYRGQGEEYSNQYWFSGTEPADATAWKALADAIIASQKTIIDPTASLVRAYGHNNPDPHAANVWTWDYLAASTSVAGTFAPGTALPMPGDCAVWIRWKVNRLSSKGKPIYLRKYYHPAYSPVGGGDAIYANLKTALDLHGTKMMDGTLPSSRHVVSPLHGDDTIAFRSSSAYITTRTLKRRGKRPPT
jgi:hypothetical protein